MDLIKQIANLVLLPVPLLLAANSYQTACVKPIPMDPMTTQIANLVLLPVPLLLAKSSYLTACVKPIPMDSMTTQNALRVRLEALPPLHPRLLIPAPASRTPTVAQLNARLVLMAAPLMLVVLMLQPVSVPSTPIRLIVRTTTVYALLARTTVPLLLAALLLQPVSVPSTPIRLIVRTTTVCALLARTAVPLLLAALIKMPVSVPPIHGPHLERMTTLHVLLALLVLPQALAPLPLLSAIARLTIMEMAKPLLAHALLAPTRVSLLLRHQSVPLLLLIACALLVPTDLTPVLDALLALLVLLPLLLVKLSFRSALRALPTIGVTVPHAQNALHPMFL
jgi:hypothetical protein